MHTKQNLTTQDLFNAAELIKACLDVMPAETLQRIRDGEMSKEDMGYQVMLSVADVAPRQGVKFMAGVCGMSEIDFLDKPMDFPLEVVKELKDRSDLRDFFGKARRMLER